ncbi:methyltransferase domain-containing protein [Mesorhizobium sp. CC13]|uniref:class I SAM-dependent methyltransferase n=1 Tax=Mesorhizobium sp. CC13 TaxID=3029194 RepID=UPI003264F0B8
MSELFDGYGSSYGEAVARSIRFSGLGHDFFLGAKADLLRRLVDERQLRLGGERVCALDIGCGVGSLHPHLRGIFDRLHGCDVSEQSIERARHCNPDNEYGVCTSNLLPYRSATFDIAFASCVLHHVAPTSWPGFVEEMRRVVRPGGVACIIEHNPFNPLTRLAVMRCPFDEDAVLLGARKARALLVGAGFRQVRSEHFLLLPTPGRIAKAVERGLAAFPLGAQYACSARV